MSNPMQDIVMLNVWIHSNADTGEPDSVDVLEIDGKVHMQWFADVFESDHNNQDLANQFFKHLNAVDDSAWFEVRPMYETATEPPEAYVDVLKLVAT